MASCPCLGKLLLWSLKMKDQHFNELIASIKESGKIKRGEIAAANAHEFPEPNIKTVRWESETKPITNEGTA
jgi:hypothetical protein